jgi:hypothetical protein
MLHVTRDQASTVFVQWSEYKLVLQILPCHRHHGGAEWQLCVKAGKNTEETIGLLNKTYCSAAISCANMYRWYARFQDGREDMKDIARSGRHSTARTDENVKSKKTVVPPAKLLPIV